MDSSGHIWSLLDHTLSSFDRAKEGPKIHDSKRNYITLLYKIYILNYYQNSTTGSICYTSLPFSQLTHYTNFIVSK